MSILEMLEQSAILTFLGMGVVFMFLFILVIIIDFAGKVIVKYEGKADTAAAASCVTHTAEKPVPPEHAAAITAAFIEYQKGEANA